jgi:hypothetical protein
MAVTFGLTPIREYAVLVNATSIVVSIDPNDPNDVGAVGASLTIDLAAIPVPAVGSHVNVIGMVLAFGAFTPANLVVGLP